MTPSHVLLWTSFLLSLLAIFCGSFAILRARSVRKLALQEWYGKVTIKDKGLFWASVLAGRCELPKAVRFDRIGLLHIPPGHIPLILHCRILSGEKTRELPFTIHHVSNGTTELIFAEELVYSGEEEYMLDLLFMLPLSRQKRGFLIVWAPSGSERIRLEDLRAEMLA